MAEKMRLKKASNQNSFMKIGLYGDTGSGKTFTALLMAEYLAEKSGKRIAFLDTEHGTDFYAISIPERKIHPKAFDFDRENTRSIMFARDFLRNVDTEEYGVVIVDSATHFWDGATELYTGKKTSKDTLPMHAWSVIKKPWRQMVDAGVNGQYHWILCGREGTKFAIDASGDFENKGTKMRAEREAGYEPHFTARMFQERPDKDKELQIRMHVEKDRSGIFTFRTVTFPNDDTAIAKVREIVDAPYNYLNPKTEENSDLTTEQQIERDIAAMEQEKADKKEIQQTTYESIKSAILKANSHVALKAAFELTKSKKAILEDDLFGELEALKDQQKAEINNELARVAGVS